MTGTRCVPRGGLPMGLRTKDERKAYGMLRMAAAIERAIEAEQSDEKDRAARWAAAWGAIGGIHSPGIRLRSSILARPASRR